MSQTANDDFKNLRRLGSGCSVAFCGLFAAVGLFFSGLGVRAAWRDHASAVWPQVPGQITRSEVKETSDSDGNSYRPDIGYRYLVDGREFTGKCISFGIESFPVVNGSRGSMSSDIPWARRWRSPISPGNRRSARWKRV